MNDTSILIIKTSAIGDIVMAQPIVEGLKRKYPNARITWVVCPESASLIKGNPNVQRLIFWDKLGWRKLRKERKWGEFFKAVRSFIRELRQERYDLVLDLQGQFRTRVFARFAKASERIGFKGQEPGEWLMTHTILSRGNPCRDMGNEYFYMMEQLGIDTRGIVPQLFLTEGDKASAKEILAKAGVTGEYIVFAPFTTRPQKHWFNERWVELAREVEGRRWKVEVENHTLPRSTFHLQPSTSIIWLGGPADTEVAEGLAKDGGGISLAGKAKLGESAAIVAGARCVVGVDTGLTHIGTAFARPTVILFGSTHGYDSTERTPNTVVLHHSLPCSPCLRKTTCQGDFKCMKAITVQEVFEIVKRWI